MKRGSVQTARFDGKTANHITNCEEEMSTPGTLVHRLPKDRSLAVPGGPPAAHAQVVCSMCGWNCALRSRRRNALDLLLALFFLHPFRCRSCHRRFYRMSFLQPKPLDRKSTRL